jgi:hypothetical protein
MQWEGMQRNTMNNEARRLEWNMRVNVLQIDHYARLWSSSTEHCLAHNTSRAHTHIQEKNEASLKIWSCRVAACKSVTPFLLCHREVNSVSRMGQKSSKCAGYAQCMSTTGQVLALKLCYIPATHICTFQYTTFTLNYLKTRCQCFPLNQSGYVW